MSKEDLCKLIELLIEIDGTYDLGKESDVISKAIDVATEVMEAEYNNEL